MTPQTRFYDKDYIYSVTVTTHERFPYFEEPILCNLWIEELMLCKRLKDFELFAFCLLPDHFHLLIQPNEKENISRVMQSFKRNFSRDANKINKLPRPKGTRYYATPSKNVNCPRYSNSYSFPWFFT